MSEELTHDSPPPRSTAEVIIRVLSPEETDKLKGVGLFEVFDLPDMQHAIPIVAQEAESGKIVGYWLIFDSVHVEPLWIDEEHRKRPGLARRLWAAVQKELVDRKVPIAFAIIADNDSAQNLPQATRLGFKKVPGSLYFVEVAPESREGWKSATDHVIEIMKEHSG